MPILGLTITVQALKNKIIINKSIDELASHPFVFSLTPKGLQDNHRLRAKRQPNNRNETGFFDQHGQWLLAAHLKTLEVTPGRIWFISRFINNIECWIAPRYTPDWEKDGKCRFQALKVTENAPI